MINGMKNLPAEKRRAATVQAVVQLAADCNPSDITTSAIASVMGLTQGALFRHFLSKDVIWKSVMEWVSESLLTRVDQVIEHTDSPLATLEAIFMTHIDFATKYPGVPRMLLSELQRTGMTPAKQVARTLLQKYGERVTELINTGKAFGEVSADVESASAATLFIGTIQGLVLRSALVDAPHMAQTEATGVFNLYRRSIEQRQ